MTAELTLPNPVSTTSGSGIDHYVCGCDEDTALCGKDLTNGIWVDDDDDSAADCIVCFDLSQIACQGCGAF